MKEVMRSGSGEKTRRPFGCLIIKKKDERMVSSGGGGGGGGGGTVGGGGGGSGSLAKTMKKRPRLILSDSESEEDLLFGSSRRNLISSNGGGGGGSVGGVDRERVKLEPVKFEEDRSRNVEGGIERKMSKAGVFIGGEGDKTEKKSLKEYEKEIEVDRRKIKLEPVKFEVDVRMGKNRLVEGGNEKRRSKAEVFGRAEGDSLDKKFLKKERLSEKGIGVGRDAFFSAKSPVPSGKHREIETGGSRGVTVMKRKHSDFDRRKSFAVEQNREADYADNKKRMKMNEGGFHSVDHSRGTFGIPHCQPIRVQGKNGVLKVMVNNRNKVSGPEKFYGGREAEETRKLPRSADSSNWITSPSPSLYSEPKSREKSRSVVVEDKGHVNSLKNLSAKHIKACDGRKEIRDVSLPQDLENVGTYSSKEVRNKGDKILKSEANPPARSNEGKVRRGCATEKQLLREQIRKMILDAGWTIDFRPRKCRNYQDAVYISPSGTEYWSIVKAYNALQKYFEDSGSEYKHSGNNSSFTPIPEEVLSQLTRQTKKKIERDMKMKQKAEGVNKSAKEGSKKREKNKHAGKSLKVKIKGNSSVGLNTKDLDMSQKSNIHPESAGNSDGESLPYEQGNSSDALHKGTQKPTADKKPSYASDVNIFQRRKVKKKRGRALLVRGSNNGLNLDDDGDDDFVPYIGKRTVLSWLVDMETVPLSGKVQYMNKKRTQAMLEGWITRDGIHCGCCSKILTVSKFEIHAGSKLHRPFQNIILENGVSLLQCQLNAWHKLEKYIQDGFYSIKVDGDDPNDDTCGICGDGGDLICCDGCPSTFHQSCLGIQMLPPGDWHCTNCSCKYCNGVDGSTDRGKEITRLPLCTCSLCEDKYHQLCSLHADSIPNDSDSLSTSFCRQSCKELSQQLQKLLGVKHELEEGFSWTLIHRSDLNSDPSNRVLAQKAECNSKLAVALTVMDECFLPVIDRRSGINLIQNVVFNIRSNFNRLNYGGFYTAILERGDEIICAASIRIHGTRLAEMPYIGTRHIYRRQGMCRRLLNAIESALCLLNVEKLVIPAISELMHTWTAVFGFKPLEESQRQGMRSLNMLVFPSTDMLQKPILKRMLNEGDVASGSDTRANELKNSSDGTMTIKSNTVSCVDPDIIACDEGIVCAREVNDESASIRADPLVPCGLTYETSNLISNPLESEHGPVPHVPREESAHSESKLEPKTEAISNSFVQPKYSTEGAANGAYDLNVVAEPNILACDEGEVHAREMNNGSASVGAGLLGPGGSTYETSNLISNPLGAERRTVAHAPREESVPNLDFLHCGVNRNSKLEVEAEPISNSFVEAKYSMGDANGARDFNVVAGVELDNSLVGTSVQHTTITNSDGPNAISGQNFHPSGLSPMRSNSELNQPNNFKAENGSVPISNAVSDAPQLEEDVRVVSDQRTEPGACEVRSEIPAAGPDSYTFEEGRADKSYDINILHQDAACMNFQGSDKNITSNYSEGTNQPLNTVSERNCQGSDEALEHHHDSGFLTDIKGSAFDTTDTHGLENEVASVEPNSKTLGEDPGDRASEVVGSSCMLLKRGVLELEVEHACKDVAFSCQNDEVTRQQRQR